MRGAPGIGEVLGRRGPTAVRRRSRRRRRRRWLLGGAVLLLAVAAVPAGRWLATAPLFAVDRIEAGPYRFTDPAELQPVLRGALGRSLWGRGPSRLARELEALPWVREARIERRLPSRLLVQLHEWRPLLAVAAPPAGGEAAGAPRRLLLLENGALAAPAADLPLPSLPVLVGAEVGRGAGGGATLGSDGAAALELMRAVAETGLEAAAPVDYVVAGEQGLGLVLQGRAATLLLGRDDFAKRLRLFLATRDQVAAGADVDLRFDGLVTVREAPADSAGGKQKDRQARPGSGAPPARRTGSRAAPAQGGGGR